MSQRHNCPTVATVVGDGFGHERRIDRDDNIYVTHWVDQHCVTHAPAHDPARASMPGDDGSQIIEDADPGSGVHVN
jgi:hypothetical protein